MSTNETIYEVMEWAYDKAVDGLPGMGSAIELAEDYLKDVGRGQHRIWTIMGSAQNSDHIGR